MAVVPKTDEDILNSIEDEEGISEEIEKLRPCRILFGRR